MMGLKFWVPLNGDLHNQGCSGVNFTNVGATIDNNGKIGKCYYLPNTSSTIYSDLFTPDVNTFSICGWFKATTSNTNNGYVFGLSTASAPSFMLYREATTNFRIYLDGSSTLSQTVDTTQWHHYAITYTGSRMSLYIDGEFIARRDKTINFTTNSYRLFLGARSNNGNTNGAISIHCGPSYFNDIRYYNHCLSATEVREISQGLVLHYKLDNLGSGFGNPNLCKNSRTFGTGWGGSGAITQNAFEGFAVKYKDNTSGTGNTDTVVYNNVLTVNPNEVFTVSFWAKADTAHNINCFFYNNASGVVQNSRSIASTGATGTATDGNTVIALTTEWKYYWITWTFASSGTAATKHLILGRNAKAQSGVSIAKVKIEKGDSATPWAPHPNDGEAITSYIEDSSGYNHNGTINGTLTLSNDTPRYSISTQFPSTAYIKITSPSTEIKTVSLWAKWNSIPSGQSIIYVDQKSKTGLGLASNGIIINANQTGKTFNKSALVANTWYHFVIISPNGSSNATRKLYINGVEQTALSSTNSWSYTIDELQLGKRSTSSDGFNGKISDFRMYCTALDADAIRQLYEVGAKVDNKNNVHSFELNEDGKNEITKTGQLKCSTFTEFAGMSYLKYDPNLYIEPDGSCWVHIFHHDHPTGNKFSSTDPFATSVYKNESKWFNVEVCNYVSTWELMVKQQTLLTEPERKFRWIQTVNPMTAAYADISPSKITKITTDGYESTLFTSGGLYKKNGNVYLATDTGSSSSWWGGIGVWASDYQGGIPGFGFSDNSTNIVKDGHIDLYVRIDNVTFTSPIAKSTKNNIWTGNEIIEL